MAKNDQTNTEHGEANVDDGNIMPGSWQIGVIGVDDENSTDEDVLGDVDVSAYEEIGDDTAADAARKKLIKGASTEGDIDADGNPYDTDHFQDAMADDPEDTLYESL